MTLMVTDAKQRPEDSLSFGFADISEKNYLVRPEDRFCGLFID